MPSSQSKKPAGRPKNRASHVDFNESKRKYGGGRAPAALKRDWQAPLTEIVAPASTFALHSLALSADEQLQRRPVGRSDNSYRSIVKLFAYRAGDADPVKAGTGLFLSPDFLVTVAHVLFDGPRGVFGLGRKGYADHVRIQSPAFALPPALEVTDRFVAAPGYTDFGDVSFDLAVIRLRGSIENSIPLSPTPASDAELKQLGIYAYGYPKLSDDLSFAPGVCVGATSNLVFHTADVTEGQSGGALVAAREGQAPVLLALHRAGPEATPRSYPYSSGAVRLNAQALQWIDQMEAML